MFVASSVDPAAHSRARQTRRRSQPTEAERAARWADLRHAIFGDASGRGCRRPRRDRRSGARGGRRDRAGGDQGGPRHSRPIVRGLYLVIDYNPSPLAAHFVLGPLADARSIETRVRIDDYTYLHAIAETADGRLYATARFIKAAGGCSAPAGKDQALALERLGKMKLTARRTFRSRCAGQSEAAGQPPEQFRVCRWTS